VFVCVDVVSVVSLVSTRQLISSIICYKLSLIEICCCDVCSAQREGLLTESG